MTGGCATGELPESNTNNTNTGPCKNNMECPEGQICNLITGECRTPNIVPDMGDMTPTDMPTDMTPTDMPVDMPVDMSGCMPACNADENCINSQCVPKVITCDPPCNEATHECKMGTCVMKQTATCNPTCAETEVCQMGTCVPATCNPACESPGVCTAQGCKYPACQNEGERCELGSADQNGLTCLFNRSTGEARCFKKCEHRFTAIGCATGQYCLGVSGNDTLSYCDNSECSQNSECTDGNKRGSCIILENEFGFCEESGTAAVGSACDLSSSVPSERCVQGASCRTPQGSSAGTCVLLCNPWGGAATGCSTGERCALLTAGIGYCTTSLDSSGTQHGDQCQLQGAWCDNATQCFGLSTSNLCIRYCRPDSTTDCNGTGLTACNPYIFTGDKTLGLCDLDCSQNTSVCGSSRICAGKNCRPICTPATYVQDCCGGETPCDFQCLSNGAGQFYCD